MAKENATVKVIKPVTPVGVDPIKHVVTEVVKPKKGVATYKSYDGQVYSLPTHNTKGEPLPERETLCILAALREVALGGNPNTVMEAFNVKIVDLGGKTMFPIEPSEIKTQGGNFSMGNDE